ncbi:hypothetical protein HPB50_021336 [Hyalomma asiaticum]|uniref:Uncharacterized protein n=1 Tax=Hyalomma asiaticum TaxID=266040 RepID=A0ACB7SWX9_HYAAI|nr:hypothetical protein HPB50_021336 [Hyalomma asiaticum]
MLNLFRNNRGGKAAAAPSGLRVPLAPDRRVRAQSRYKAAAWLFFLQMEKTLGRFHRVLNLPGFQDCPLSSPSGSSTVISLPWTGSSQKEATACPLGDREFRACLDNEGRLLKPQELRLEIYKGGVEPSLRKGADDNVNVVSLFNLLTTFALNHPSLSYCQGMSDLASPLLVVMRDEPHAYVCFCALMRRLGPSFDADGEAMTLKFKHLSDLVEHFDSAFFRYLEKCGAQDLLFCYRWLLLELKREFSFDDALRMLEVQWSSLPPMPPDGELSLFERPYQVDDVLPCAPQVTHSCTSSQAKAHVVPRQSPPTAASVMTLAEDVDGTANGDDHKHGARKPVITSATQEQSTELIGMNQRSRADTWSDGRGDNACKCDPYAEDQPKLNRVSEDHIFDDHGVSSSGASMEDSGAVPRTNVSIAAKKWRRRHSANVHLPRPQELGGGNPFMMFLCLAILTQHRDVIMRKGMDYNELAMHFDKLVRRHDLQSVLQRARALYAKYLSFGWDEPLEQHPRV